MKKISILVLIFSIFSFTANSQNYGKLHDTRDGKTYKTIQIGEQVWMAENLNFEASKSWCYANDTANCAKYGRLYFLESAQNACPTGWHLPSDDEWKQLEQSLGMSKEQANVDKAWRGTNEGEKLLSDSTLGFNILLGGYRNPPANNMLEGMQAFFWTSTIKNSLGYMRQFYIKNKQIYRRVRPKNWAFSVRCVKD